MNIKIEGEEYSIKLKASEISLYDYLTIVDILMIDEEEMDEEGKNIEIIRYISDIHPKYYGEPKIIQYFIDKLNENLLNVKVKPIEDKFLGKYSHKEPKKWIFYQWVMYESFIKNGHMMDGKKINGHFLYLPLMYTIGGKFDVEMKDFDDKIKELLFDLPFDEVIMYHQHLIEMTNNIKKNHYYVYMYEGGTGGGNNPNMKNHSEVFGWMETMRDLSEKGVFGTYLQLKDAPLFDVLAFLNVQIGRSVAESDDMLINKTKK